MTKEDEVNVELILYRLNEMKDQIAQVQADIRTGLVNDTQMNVRLDHIESEGKKAGLKAGAGAGAFVSAVIAGTVAGVSYAIDRLRAGA